jgi:hypothetical protein
MTKMISGCQKYIKKIIKMDADTPIALYERHQDEVCNILSQVEREISSNELETWIAKISRQLCGNKDSIFRTQFQKIIRKEARMILQDKIIDPKSQASAAPKIQDEKQWDPQLWATVKVFRDDLNKAQSGLTRYSKTLVKPIRFQVIDP